MEHLILKYRNLFDNFSIEDENTIEEFIDFIYSLNEDDIESRVLVSIYKKEILSVVHFICHNFPKINIRKFYETFNQLDIKQVLINYFVHNDKTHYNLEILKLYFYYNDNYKLTTMTRSNLTEIEYLENVFLNQVNYYLNSEIGYYTKTQIEYKDHFQIIVVNNYKDLNTIITLKLT